MENVDSLVLEHLMQIRSRVDQVSDEVNDLKFRMSNFELECLRNSRSLCGGIRSIYTENG
jgi:hypothetical protein